MKIIKHKELKRDVHYAIPCKRENGEDDYFTFVVREDEYGVDVAYVNNRFMGAHLAKADDDNLFKIVS